MRCSSLLHISLLLAGSWLAGATPLHAQAPGAAFPPEPSPPTVDEQIEDLRQRLDAMEAQNRALLSAVEEAKTLPEPSKPGPLDMKASWDNGLTLSSPDKHFKFHAGGRTQIDAAWADAPDAVQTGPGESVRCGTGRLPPARIRLDGTMYEQIEWATHFDFVNSVNVDPTTPATQGNVDHIPAPTDLWLTFTHLPVVGNFRVGNQKEPIGLEHLTSSRFLDFMERSFNQDAFTGPFNNGFSPGLSLFNTSCDERMTWAAGVYKNTTNAFAYGVGDGEYAATGRVTVLPWYEEEGRYLLHLGAAASHRDLDEDSIRVRARGSVRSGPPTLNNVLANTGTFFGDSQDLLGAEVALVNGPLLIQAEYIASLVDESISGGVPRGTVFFQGSYVEALYFLTGEHRVYNRKSGAFDRVVPLENFTFTDCTRGLGAWQVGARYNYLDLNDSGVNGGMLSGATLGLNWFLNPNLKIQWNYDVTRRYAQSPAADGNIHAFGTRFAWDF